MTHRKQAHPALGEATETLDALLTVGRRLSPDATLSRTAAYSLGALHRLGPIRLTALAEHEAVSQPAMTGLIRRLEAAGLVTREDDPDDGRAVLVGLTDTGRARVEARRRRYAALIEDMLRDLDPDDLDHLVAALPALRRLTLLAQDTKETR
ncbi:MAG: MarR family transcriptional regulator [Nocardioidaceae bacterium]